LDFSRYIFIEFISGITIDAHRKDYDIQNSAEFCISPEKKNKDLGQYDRENSSQKPPLLLITVS